MKEVVSGNMEPIVPEVPPFELQDPDLQIKTLKRNYTLSLKVKKSATTLRKTIKLDDNTNLSLTIQFTK